VAAARIAGRERVPTFDELLGAWPGLRINVEPKSDAAVEPLCEAIRRAGAIDRVCIGSFSDARVERARALLGERLCTSPGQRAIAALWAAAQTGVTARARARLSRLLGGAGCVQIPTRHRRVPVTTRRMVDACHTLGLDVHVWTVDDPAEMTRLLDLGVDGLMTDQPAVLKSVLERRGQWTG
jgi:glycerophosphoryl diester phosphodiesterase